MSSAAAMRGATGTLRKKLESQRVDLTLYYLAFGLFQLQSFVSGTNFESVLFVDAGTFQTLCRYALIAFLALKLIFQRTDIWRWIASAIIVLVGFLTLRSSGAMFVFWLAIFIGCGKDVDVKPLAAITLIIFGVGTILTVACSYAGVIENIVVIDSSRGLRQSLGFSHVNSLGRRIFELNVALMVLRFDKSPTWDLPVIGLSFYICYFVANSRTAAFCLLVAGVLRFVFFFFRSKEARKAASICFIVFTMLVIIGSFYFMVAYSSSNSLMAELNKLLSNRLKYSNYFYSLDSLTLFGRDYSAYLTGDESFLVDNAFCHLILRFGLVPTIMYICSLGLFFARAVRTNQWDACLFGMVLFVFYGFGESMMLGIGDNYFLIAFSSLLFDASPALLHSAKRTRQLHSHIRIADYRAASVGAAR